MLTSRLQVTYIVNQPISHEKTPNNASCLPKNLTINLKTLTQLSATDLTFLLDWQHIHSSIPQFLNVQCQSNLFTSFSCSFLFSSSIPFLISIHPFSFYFYSFYIFKPIMCFYFYSMYLYNKENWDGPWEYLTLEYWTLSLLYQSRKSLVNS